VALQVGELNGTITIDDRGVSPALRRAENALRVAGQQMGDDAERAGQQAGEQLGDGIVRGADGRLRDARGRFVAAGRQAGEEVGEGLADGAGEGADNAVDQAGSRLDQLKLLAAGAGLAAGAAIGAALVEAFNEALDQSKITAKLGAQLGTTPAEAQRYGRIAGDLYSSAIVEDFQAAADTIKAVMNAGLLPPDSTNRQIKSMATRLADLATVLEMDVGEAANAAGIMVRNGLAKNAEEAIDMLVQASNAGANRFGDLGDTITQSANNLSHFGLTGEQALGVMVQGLDKGAPSAELFAGALEEMAANAGDGAELFDELGFSGAKMAKDLAGGGPAAGKALDQLMDKLRTMKDPTERSAAMVELFGEEAVAMQDALLSVDPSEAASKLGDFSGAADKAGKTLHDSAGTRVEAFKRTLQQNLVEFLGGTVIPALFDFQSRARTILGGLWDQAGKGSEKGADQIANFMVLVGRKVVEKAVELTPKILSAMHGVGQRVAEYVMANPDKVLKIAAIAGAFLFAIAKLPLLVAAGLSAVAISMMVGFVSRIITATNENLPKWWASFTGWVSKKASQAGTFMAVLGTAIGRWFGGLWSRNVAGPVSRQWNSWLSSVRGLPQRTTVALALLGARLAATALSAWQRFKDSTARKAGEVISYVRGIPGRARNALGNLGSYLWSAGASLINGFISGIRAKIGQVRDAVSDVLSAARNFFPHSPAKEGPFSGRGYTLYSGQALVRDFGKGVAGQAPKLRKDMLALVSSLPSLDAEGSVAVRPSMAGLVDTPTPSAWAASSGQHAARRASPSVLRVEFAGPEEVTRLLRGIVLSKGGGDVQLALGRR
jgi:hypothetical protein